MDIHVASLNPSKIQAVEETLQEYDYFNSARILAITVTSGVSDQPKDIEEITLGAKTRAYNAFVDCLYSIGLEAGIINSKKETKEKSNISICSIYDGSNFYFGRTSPFEIPHDISKYMEEQKVELNEAVHKCGYTNDPNIKHKEGLIGILTKGKTTRTEYIKPAIRKALSQIPEIQDK